MTALPGVAWGVPMTDRKTSASATLAAATPTTSAPPTANDRRVRWTSTVPTARATTASAASVRNADANAAVPREAPAAHHQRRGVAALASSVVSAAVATRAAASVCASTRPESTRSGVAMPVIQRAATTAIRPAPRRRVTAAATRAERAVPTTESP